LFRRQRQRTPFGLAPAADESGVFFVDDGTNTLNVFRR